MYVYHLQATGSLAHRIQTTVSRVDLTSTHRLDASMRHNVTPIMTARKQFTEGAEQFNSAEGGYEKVHMSPTVRHTRIAQIVDCYWARPYRRPHKYTNATRQHQPATEH